MGFVVLSVNLKIPRVSLSKAMLIRSPTLFIVGLFVLCLVVSLVWYFIAGADSVKRTLFFPKATRMGLPEDAFFLGEIRFLPRMGEVEADVRLLVEDLVLGPVQPDHAPFLPASLEVDSVVFDKGELYIGLSKNFIDENPEWITMDEQLQGIANTVLYNFPRTKQLHLLIDGQIPINGIQRSGQTREFNTTQLH